MYSKAQHLTKWHGHMLSVIEKWHGHNSRVARPRKKYKLVCSSGAATRLHQIILSGAAMITI
jgi:hypothetical protein